MVLALAGVAAASAPPIKKRNIARCSQLPAPAWAIQASCPQGGADHKAKLQADDVDKPAAQRLENRVSQLKRADDPRVLFGSNAEGRFQFRRDNSQRVACDVVDGNAK